MPVRRSLFIFLLMMFRGEKTWIKSIKCLLIFDYRMLSFGHALVMQQIYVHDSRPVALTHSFGAIIAYLLYEEKGTCLNMLNEHLIVQRTDHYTLSHTNY